MSSNQLPPPNLVRQPTGRFYAAGLFPELTSVHANPNPPPTTSTIDEAALFASLASPTRSSPSAPPPPPVTAPPPFDYLSYLNDETPVMSEVVVDGPVPSTSASAHQFLSGTNADPNLRALVTSTPSPKTLAADDVPPTPKLDIADIAVMIKSLEARVERVFPTAESAVKKSQKSLARSRVAQDQRGTQHRITLIEESLVHIRDNASHATRKVHTEVRNLAAEFTRTNQRLDNVVALLHKNKSSLK